VRDRRSVAYRTFSDSGTRRSTICVPPRVSIEVIFPRRPLRSPMMSPMYSSGTTNLDPHHRLEQHGLPRRAASLKPIEPAILNASSEESTSWYDPS